MVTLAIHTASTYESLVLSSKGKILSEKSWKGNSDESEVLLPTLEKLLKKSRLKYKDIKRIIVVSGPGPFSALRIGVTVANILAHTLKVPLYSVSTEALWELRKPESTALLLLHAGGRHVARIGKGYKRGIFPIEEALNLNKKRLAFFGDLTENQSTVFKELRQKEWHFIPEEKLLPISEMLSKLPPKLLKKERVAVPLYFRPPNITLPKK